MHGSSASSGIGRQAVNVAPASAMVICRAARPMRRMLIPRCQWGSHMPSRPRQAEGISLETDHRHCDRNHQQQPDHHPAQQHQVALVSDGSV